MVRTTLPLLIMYVNDDEPIEGRTRLQKMVFLLLKNAQFFTNGYSFLPHDYGPYSKELQDDIDYLIEKKYVREDRKTIEEGKIKYVYSITESGMEIVNRITTDRRLDSKFRFSDVLKLSGKIKGEMNHKDITSLLFDIYESHPEYAVNSKFKF